MTVQNEEDRDYDREDAELTLDEAAAIHLYTQPSPFYIQLNDYLVCFCSSVLLCFIFCM